MNAYLIVRTSIGLRWDLNVIPVYIRKHIYFTINVNRKKTIDQIHSGFSFIDFHLNVNIQAKIFLFEPIANTYQVTLTHLLVHACAYVISTVSHL